MGPTRSEIVFNVLRDHFRQMNNSRLYKIVEHLQNNLGIGKRKLQIPQAQEGEIIMPMTLLFVDDNVTLVRTATRYMGDIRPQWRFLLAHTLGEARRIYDLYSPPDAAVLDVDLPDGNGLDFLIELRHRYPGLPVIMISGGNSASLRQEALDRGGYAFISKPFSAPILVNHIESAITAFRDFSPVPVTPRPGASGVWSNPYALVLRPTNRKLAVYDPGAANVYKFILK